MTGKRLMAKCIWVALLLGYACADEGEIKYRISRDFVNVDRSIQFFVIGDWGRNGEQHQRDLANMMDSAGRVMKPEFIVSTGDNFYPTGVLTTSDTLWRSSYENIYSGAPLQCPWYVALGNHDYAGNVQAEIDYSKSSSRWNMPSRYFTFVKEVGNTRVRFVVADTSPFEKDYYTDASYKREVTTQDSTRQKVWLDSVLSLADTDWKIVIGHHPLYSGGTHSLEGSPVRASLESIFTKNNVDIYFAGHEHDLQHLKPDDKPTHYFISGAGSQIRPTGLLPISKFAKSIQGFMAVSVQEQQVRIQVVSYRGDLLYSYLLKK
jgi:tartrate-resistant acid phosphatase type 5